jgi:hypothetical protein
MFNYISLELFSAMSGVFVVLCYELAKWNKEAQYNFVGDFKNFL